jgi:nucleoside-diphosphate-sugar epimerase
MIVGNGLIAKTFKNIDSEKFIFFLSGVSNSLCKDPDQFKRETQLIKFYIKKYPEKIIVYLSTTSIEYKKTKYTKHKKKIEDILENSKIKYYIFRIPQIIGFGGNENNFFNFLLKKIKNGLEFKAYDTYRSVIDLDDLSKIINFLIENNSPGKYNFYGIEFIKVLDFIHLLEKKIGKKANYKIIKIKEKIIKKNSKKIQECIKSINLNIENYHGRLIEKYINS